MRTLSNEESGLVIFYNQAKLPVVGRGRIQSSCRLSGSHGDAQTSQADARQRVTHQKLTKGHIAEDDILSAH